MIMTQCKRCGNCCKYPCPLEPEDLKIISEHFNLTEQETIDKYLIWDYWVSDEGGYNYYLCPKRKGDIDNIVDFGLAFAGYDGRKCIFLEQNGKYLCKIHKVKPRGGKEFNCKEDKPIFSKENAWETWETYPLNPNNIKPTSLDYSIPPPDIVPDHIMKKLKEKGLYHSINFDGSTTEEDD